MGAGHSPHAAPIVIVGAGNMGGAIARGLADAGLGPRLLLIDPAIQNQTFEALVHMGARTGTDVSTLGQLQPEAIILAVKPQIMAQVAPAWRNAAKQALTISIAAGTTIDSLNTWLGAPDALVRVMPNLPASLGKGISAGFATASTSDPQRRLTETLMQAVGDFVWVESEHLIDAVTAVSGSGPAYVFLLVEALATAARDAGLPPDIADRLARKTIEGAGALLEQSSSSPKQLRESVTSPGGTTEAALREFMTDHRLEKLVTEAVRAATRRAGELSKSR
jgi:pyrroline-5-carboxylate reductase